jgi:hypothetical protein
MRRGGELSIMATIGGQRINEYTNSMFRYEQLSKRWIASCAAYLQSLFGEELRGKTVVDYAFGRGNWSLAFLKGFDPLLSQHRH